MTNPDCASAATHVKSCTDEGYEHEWELREEVVGDNTVPNGGERVEACLQCAHCGATKAPAPEDFGYDD